MNTDYHSAFRWNEVYLMMQQLNMRDCKYNRIIIINMTGMLIIKGASIIVGLLMFPAYMSFFVDNRILGTWFTLLSILNWILIFDLGLGNGLRNKLPKAFVERNFVLAQKLVSSTYTSTIVLSSILFFIIFFSSFLINWNEIFNVPVELIRPNVLLNTVQIILFGIFLQFTLKIISSILLALQKSALINLIGLLSNLIILIFLNLVGNNNLSESLITLAVLNVFATNVPLVVFTIWIFHGELRDIRPSITYFDKRIANELLSIGMTILWLQLIFLVVSNMNEILISSFSGAGCVVQYQAYSKLYNTGAVVFSLALAPVWSAVTRAQSEKNYKWIKRIYKFFIACTVLCLVIEIILTFFGQGIFDMWLGKNAIEFDFFNGIVFAFHSFLFILHNVNTSISNGLSYFKFQIIGMTLAAIMFIPLAYYLTMYLESWVGVILASCISIVFYEFLAPYFTFRHIIDIEKIS